MTALLWMGKRTGHRSFLAHFSFKLRRFWAFGLQLQYSCDEHQQNQYMKRSTAGTDRTQAHNFHIDQVEDGQHAQESPGKLCHTYPAPPWSTIQSNRCQCSTDYRPAKPR